jgi:hypothetical protein
VSVAEPDENNRQGMTSKSGFKAPRNNLDLDADNPNDIEISLACFLVTRSTAYRLFLPH